MVPPPPSARPLRPFPLIHHSWQVTKPTHPIMALTAVRRSPPQFMKTRVACFPVDESKGEKGRGWERQPIFLHSALPLPPPPSIIILLSTPVSLCFQHQRWWLKKKIVLLILPKSMPSLQATFLVVVFSSGQVLLDNTEEKLLSHIAMVAKFILTICHHGNVMSHFSSRLGCSYWKVVDSTKQQ